MSISLNAPGDNARRDRYGRYLVVPPAGGKPKGYTRATTVAKALDDTSNLMKWGNRMTALGLAQRPDLLALVQAADPEDRNELDKVCERAKEAGGATARRDLGTALHTMVEKSHADPAWKVPDAYAADVAAVNATIAAAGYEVVDGMSEIMVVLDRHQIAGTSDLTLRRSSDGRLFIADLKTGASVKYGALAWAIQLAVYAAADNLYRQGDAADGTADERLPMPDVDRCEALILHVQPGSGICDVHALDIAAGADALECAMAVRTWRSRKGLLTLVGGGDAVGTAVAPAPSTPAPAVEAIPVAPDAGQVGEGDQDPSPADPIHVSTALDAVVHQARVAWALRRIEVIKAHPQAPATMVQLWPTHIPRPAATPGGPGNWTGEQLDAVVHVLDRTEAAHDMPFGDVDPAQAAAQAQRNLEAERRATERATPRPTLTAPDDGDELAAAEDVEWLRRVVLEMESDEQSIIIGWLKDAQTAGVPWSMAPVAAETPRRRYEISRAALELVTLVAGDDADTGPRTALALVLGDVAADRTNRVGALLGILDVDQADRLATICETHDFAAGDDGTPRLVAAA